MLEYLRRQLETVPFEEWKTVVICYDNMCHLDDLRAARVPLPTSLYPEPYDRMWLEVCKIIDKLHISNHVRPKCKTKYNPDAAKNKTGVDLNTMAAEQTFSWLSRFKKILGAMPKNRHHFTLHRVVLRRNDYIRWCHRMNRSAVLPKPNLAGDN